MALKPDRKITDGTDISFFMNQTAEKGCVVVLSSAGSGAAMDDSSALAKKPTEGYGSGEYVLGLLLCDVVSGDLTKTHLNQHKDEVQVGSKVTLLKRGTILTNWVETTTNTITAGHAAFIGTPGTDGKLCSLTPFTAGTDFVSVGLGGGSNNTTGTLPSHLGVNATNPALTRVGTWLSSKDSDGYAKLEVNLI